MDTIKQPLSKTQREILKAFRHNLSEEDLKNFRHHIAIFFAEKLMDEADKVWEKEEWSEEKVQELLHTKMRRRPK